MILTQRSHKCSLLHKIHHAATRLRHTSGSGSNDLCHRLICCGRKCVRALCVSRSNSLDNHLLQLQSRILEGLSHAIQNPQSQIENRQYHPTMLFKITSTDATSMAMTVGGTAALIHVHQPTLP